MFDFAYRRLIREGVIPETTIPILMYAGGDVGLSHLAVTEKDKPDTGEPHWVQHEDIGGLFLNVAACAGVQSRVKGLEVLFNACAKAEENLTLDSFDSTSRDYDVVLRKKLSKNKMIDVGYRYENHNDEGYNDNRESGSFFFNYKF